MSQSLRPGRALHRPPTTPLSGSVSPALEPCQQLHLSMCRWRRRAGETCLCQSAHGLSIPPLGCPADLVASLCSQLCWKGAQLLTLPPCPLPHTLQFFLVASALCVGYTRCLTPNHWSDVLMGLLHCTLVVHFTVCYISDFFKTLPHSTLAGGRGAGTEAQTVTDADPGWN